MALMSFGGFRHGYWKRNKVIVKEKALLILSDWVIAIWIIIVIILFFGQFVPYLDKVTPILIQLFSFQ